MLAYADLRFNPDIDMKTGFHTRNILCMPIYDQEGEIIGVIQVINKLPEPIRFSKEDEMQLASFSSLGVNYIPIFINFK